MSIIKTDMLSVGYEKKCVASNISFEVSAGDYLSVVGDNGSGKSTLIKTLAGLLPPLSGIIEYGDGFSRRNVGYLPQQTAAQTDFPASVREIVLSGCLGGCGILPFYSKEQKMLAEKNMARLGITDIEKRCFRELSGGQQQRALLARALCASSTLIILDEPVTGLDPKVTEDMYSIISELNCEGITVIMISHDVSSAIKYSSHILHMARKPKFFGKTEEYIKSDVFSAFLKGGGGV